jgi:hypothetical protein
MNVAAYTDAELTEIVLDMSAGSDFHVDVYAVVTDMRRGNDLMGYGVGRISDDQIRTLIIKHYIITDADMDCDLYTQH